MLLKCRVCKKEKALELFYNNCNNKKRYGKDYTCKECSSLRRKKQRRSLNPRENFNIHINALLNGIKNRVLGRTKKSTAYNKEFTIVRDDLVNLYQQQDGRCALSGIQMTSFIGYGYMHYNVSVDRIDQNIGYVKSNIRLVCNSVNRARGIMNDEEFLTLCKIINEYNNGKWNSYKKIA